MKKEEERLSFLKKYTRLSVFNDGSFDLLAEVIQKIYGVSCVVISIVDEDEVLFKSKIGIDLTEVPRYPSLCNSVISNDKLITIDDVNKETSYNYHESILFKKYNFNFFASTPIRVRDQYNLGTLSIFHHEKIKFSKQQKIKLEKLSLIIAKQIEVEIYNLKLAYYIEKMELLHYIVAHDLKSPVRSIKNVANFIKEDENLTVEGLKNVDLIENLSDNVVNIISGLLEIQKSDMGKTSTKIHFSCLLKQVMDNLYKNILDNDVEIMIDCDEQFYILGNETLLVSFFQNIIENAIKYSKKEIKSIIKIVVKEIKGEYEVSIQDNGVGIANTVKVFDPFFIENKKKTNQKEGMGLGLYIVKKIADIHGIKILLKSEKGKGTHYTFYFNKVEL
ncbi:alkaline phosphatase synthesis sensor protein PhoR [Flavobacteriaceae bacterium UJ101]|nr:alkaline phosphatase synthesis sensor protein PhoR [Flavobacteriaceae bacterium UJ101]